MTTGSSSGSIVLAVAALGCGASSAAASFHLMQIEQVIGGVNEDVTAQAVQLRMRSAGQGQLQFSRLRVFDAAGMNPVLLIDLDDSVFVVAAGSRILVASPNFAQYTSPPVVPDFTMTNLIPASYLLAGSLTFEDDSGTVYWRLSWGGTGYTGSNLGDSTNDDDSPQGDFGPPIATEMFFGSLQAVFLTGSASDPSTSNFKDYTFTADRAVFQNNAGASVTVINRPVPGDLDDDQDFDLEDYFYIFPCIVGPDVTNVPNECGTEDFAKLDLDGDGDVDLEDVAEILLSFTGPNP